MAEPIVSGAMGSLPHARRGRTIGLVSILTVMVAGVGYFREAVLAARFGLSSTMDAYFGALFIPTMVYTMLIAGTISPVFIPILVEDEKTGDPNRLSETFSIVTNFVLLFLGAIVLCALATAAQWLSLLFPGFSPETADVTRKLVYIIFPSVIFVALAGVLTATLNGFHRFALASFAPALSSIAVVVAVLVARGENALYIIGIATAVGFLLQFLLLVPATKALGIRYQLTLKLHHPAVGKVCRLGGPLLAYLVTANASSLVERNLASQLSAGAVSTLTYAMRLFTVPSNFLAAPLGIVMYPQFAREALREGHGELSVQVSRIFRLALFVFLPLTIWTMVNALPVTRLLYERGHFQLENSLVTSQVLRLYSIGILPLAVGGILLRCFYAVQDTVTALRAEAIDLVFYLVAAPFLMHHFGILGLAFTRGISFYLVCGILVFVLWRHKRLLKFDADLAAFIASTTIASVAMGIVSWLCWYVLRSVFDSGGIVFRLGVVGVLLVVSAAVFLGIAQVLKLSEAASIIRTMLTITSSNPTRNPEEAPVPVGE